MNRSFPPNPVGPAPDLPAALFADRRRLLLDRIGGGVAVVPSAPELRKSRDTEIVFRQSSDLYYLTGFPEPESLAVITPHAGEKGLTLFVRPRVSEAEAWHGPRIGVEDAAEAFGADAVYPISELAARLPELLKPASVVHYPIGEVPLLDDLVVRAVRAARGARLRTGIGPTALADLESVTGEMRLVKSPEEIQRIRTAADIGAAGHVAAMGRVRDGVGEWELQAVVEGTFRELGGASPAFPSIVGCGANATVLHYVDNRHRLRDGDLVLIDAGAEWGMYCSDITRTIPVSGRFSPEQRDLYDVVLAAEEAAIEAVRPGVPFTTIHDAAVRVLVRGLLDLKVLPVGDPDAVIEAGAYKQFYLHQTSHWLGLDVHDAGPYRRAGEPVALSPGMVFTVEPGIYIPSDAPDVPAGLRGIGIRIEDDVIVTAEGCEVITRAAPVAAEQIEAVMG